MYIHAGFILHPMPPEGSAGSPPQALTVGREVPGPNSPSGPGPSRPSQPQALTAWAAPVPVLVSGTILLKLT